MKMRNSKQSITIDQKKDNLRYLDLLDSLKYLDSSTISYSINLLSIELKFIFVLLSNF